MNDCCAVDGKLTDCYSTTWVKRVGTRHEGLNLLYTEKRPMSPNLLLLSVCTALHVTRHMDDECVNLYLQLLDRCINHEVGAIELHYRIFYYPNNRLI